MCVIFEFMCTNTKKPANIAGCKDLNTNRCGYCLVAYKVNQPCQASIRGNPEQGLSPTK